MLAPSHPFAIREFGMISHLRTSGLKGRRQLRHWIAALALLVVQLASGLACAQSDTATRDKAKPSSEKLKKNAEANETKLGHDWVRVKYDDKGKPLAMQTAIVRYAVAPSKKDSKQKPVTVDLVGAVHIGDIAYYRKLNEQFKQYDALLYELVAPEGTIVKPGRGTSNAHPIGAMQNAIKSFLELDHQLEFVDYTPANFVHADMSPDEFAQSMKDRNESFLQLYFRLMGEAMAHQDELAKNGPSDFELLSALFANDRPRRLKTVLAKQLSEMELLMVSFGGEQGSSIISERNKKALGVLNRQLADGKKRVGIFYGAGHLNDMDKRLRTDFKLEPVSVTWLTAWDLAEKK
jgi:hypothetical protein